MSNSQIHVGRNSVLFFFLTCMTQMKNDCEGIITVKMVNSIFENMYIMYLKLKTLHSGIKCYCSSSVAYLELGRIDFCMLDFIH